jgi:peptidoglycan/LPS O-acetylase OafA/YrhL
MFALNPPEWSLFFEMGINLLYAVSIRQLTTARILIGMAVAFGALAIGIGVNHTANVGWARSQIAWGTARVTYSFFAGVILYRFRNKAPAPGPRNLSAATFVCTALVLILPVSTMLRPVFDAIFIFVGVPCLVWVGSRHEPKSAVLPIAVILGEISYPIYAVHYPICAWLADYARAGLARPTVTITFGAILLLLVSYASDKLYDKPLRKIFAKALSQQASPARARIQ